MMNFLRQVTNILNSSKKGNEEFTATSSSVDQNSSSSSSSSSSTTTAQTPATEAVKSKMSGSKRTRTSSSADQSSSSSTTTAQTPATEAVKSKMSRSKRAKTSSSADLSSSADQTTEKKKRIYKPRPRVETQNAIDKRLARQRKVSESMKFFTKLWEAYDEVVGIYHVDEVGEILEDMSLFRANDLVSPSIGGMDFLRNCTSEENVKKICTRMGLAVDAVDDNDGTGFTKCLRDEWVKYQKNSERNTSYRDMFNLVKESSWKKVNEKWQNELPLAVFVDLSNIMIGLKEELWNIAHFVRSIAKDGSKDRKVAYVGVFAGQKTLKLDEVDTYKEDLRAAFPDLENDDIVVYSQMMGANGKEIIVDIAMTSAMKKQTDIKGPHKFVICTGDGADVKPGDEGLPTFLSEILSRLVTKECVELVSWNVKLNSAYPEVLAIFPNYMKIVYLDHLRDVCLLSPDQQCTSSICRSPALCGLRHEPLRPTSSSFCDNFDAYKYCSRGQYCRFTHRTPPRASTSSSTSSSSAPYVPPFPMHIASLNIRSRVRTEMEQLQKHVKCGRLLQSLKDMAVTPVAIRSDMVEMDHTIKKLKESLDDSADILNYMERDNCQTKKNVGEVMLDHGTILAAVKNLKTEHGKIQNALSDVKRRLTTLEKTLEKIRVSVESLKYENKK